MTIVRKYTNCPDLHLQLKSARFAAGLDVAQVALSMGVAMHTVAYWESGNAVMEEVDLLKLEEIYNTEFLY